MVGWSAAASAPMEPVGRSVPKRRRTRSLQGQSDGLGGYRTLFSGAVVGCCRRWLPLGTLWAGALGGVLFFGPSTEGLGALRARGGFRRARPQAQGSWGFCFWWFRGQGFWVPALCGVRAAPPRGRKPKKTKEHRTTPKPKKTKESRTPWGGPPHHREQRTQDPCPTTRSRTPRPLSRGRPD